MLEGRAPDGRPTIHVNTRQELREWLEKHHAQPAGVWLVTPRKKSGLPRVEYEDIIEECLCFGWIDSTAGTFDARHGMLWLAPRRPGSVWAGTNKARVERLQAAGLLQPAGVAAIERAKADGSWDLLTEVEAGTIPPDLAEAFRRYPGSAARFAAFAPSSRRMVLGWIRLAKRAETRAARIERAAALAARGEIATMPRVRD